MAVLRQTVNLFPRGKQWWFESIPAHHNGHVAQLVEHLVEAQSVGSSNLSVTTILFILN